MILITGANGLVGSYLCRELVQRGYKVRALLRKDSDLSLLDDILGKIDRAIGDVNDIGSLIEACRGVEYIIHTAAIVSFWGKRADEMHEVNVKGTRNIVDVALESGVTKFIHVSSVAALGRKANEPNVNENGMWEDSPLNSAYAKTKYLSEVEVYRGIEEGLNAIIVNPSVILGPGLKGASSVKLFEYVQKGGRYYTEGNLNYVDVRDVADAILFLLFKSNKTGERYIISAGHVSFQQFFNQTAAVLKRRAPSVKATTWMRAMAWRIESVKAFFTNREPLITKETARTAQTHFLYSPAKLVKETGMSFRPLSDTIEWTCSRLQNG